MKKILFFASALAGLLLAGSCQREELAPATEGNVVTFEVSVPEIATKANVVDDGTNINDLVYAVYRTSATSLENAQKDENLQLIYQKNYETNPFKGNQAVVPIELINDQNYLIVFWAQVSDAWVNGNSNNLMRITYPTEMFANNSNLAAFTNATFLSADDIKGGAIKRQIELTRPFAQIRIGTTLPKNVIEDVVLTRSSVTVNGVADAFNALKQQAIVGDQPTTVEFEMAEVPDGNLTVNNVDYKYAAMNYIFANGNVGVAYNIETAQHGTVTTEAIPDVPVQRNYRTNIVGNLLTSEAKYTVTLDQDWGPEGPVDNDYVVTVANNAEDIQEAIESIPEGGSGEIKLGGDIDLGELFAASTQAVTKAGNAPLPIVVSEEKSITLDLNGFTITTPWEIETDRKHYYAFDNKGTLKIVDSKATGKIVARGIFNYGHMTLESGTIEACDGNGGYGVRNYAGAEFVMNGGTVATIYEDGDIPGEGYDACPIRVDQGAKAKIKGGIINNVSNFTVAIDNYGETIVDDGTFTSVHTTLANSAVMTINGGSFTCNGLEGITAHALWAAEGTTTINGGTFNGKDNYNGFNICASKGAVVNITGGKFLPVHSGSLYGEGTINVTGGEFFDDPSERVADGYPVYAPATEGGYYTIGEFTPVAKIGDVEYGSLQAAFNAGGEVTLISDLEVKETVILAEGKKAVLDLNGKTITSAYQAGSDSKHIYPIDNYGELTIIDKEGNGSINGRGIYNQDGARLTINAAKVIGQDWNGGACVWSYGGEVYLNNATFIGNTGCVSSKGYLEINGGTYTCYSGIADNGEQKTSPTYNVRAYNDLKITDGTFTSRHGVISMGGGKALLEAGNYTIQFNAATTSNVLYIYEDAQATINGGNYISDNTSNKADSGTAILVDGTDAAATVYGGTFVGMNGMVSGNVTLYGGTFNTVWNYNHYDNLADRIAEGYKATQNEDGSWTVSVDPVAMIGEQNYFSLQAAIDAVQEGETIVLMKDINVETPAYGQNALNYARAINFTLDLNGKTLSANTGNSVFRYNITQAGATDDVTVTIKNGTITAGADTWCVVMAAGLSADVRAVYNLEDLTINASKPGDLAVKAWDYALINAKNVTVNATKGAGGFYALGGEIVLDNCTVNQEGLWTAPYLSMAVAVSTGGKATVNSGTYTAVPTAASEGNNQGTSHGSWAAGVMNSGGELIINGGTFVNGNFGDDALATAARGLIFGDTASKIVINNGTFNALKTIIDFQNNLGTTSPIIEINGGNFSADPSKVTSYGSVVIAEGKEPKEGDDGRWTLVQK